MFRAFYQFAQFVNCATQFDNCQNARAILKLRKTMRVLEIAQNALRKLSTLTHDAQF